MFVQNKEPVTAELATTAAAVFDSIAARFPSLKISDGGRPLSRGFRLPDDVDPISVRDVISEALNPAPRVLMEGSSETIALRMGDIVRHEKFDVGEVIDFSQRGAVRIDCDEDGIHTVNAERLVFVDRP